MPISPFPPPPRTATVRLMTEIGTAPARVGVPFLDLGRSHAPLKAEILEDIAALIDRLAQMNARIADAVENHDAVGYIRCNLEFHRMLYLRAQAPAMLAMLETIWLQLGPTMRALYGRVRRNEPPRHHRMILAALRAGDEPALRLAVRADVTHGLRHLTSGEGV